MDRPTHRAIIVHLPEELWVKLQAMTPPQFRPEDTVKIAAEAFVLDCAIDAIGDQCSSEQTASGIKQPQAVSLENFSAPYFGARRNAIGC